MPILRRQVIRVGLILLGIAFLASCSGGRGTGGRVLLATTTSTADSGLLDSLLPQFEAETGRRVLGNRTASGTGIIDELGPRHLERGDWIVYTSVDSVFQLAAHEERVPLKELYRACRVARERILAGEHAVSRVIARPFVGEPGAFQRTANRRDFSLTPPSDTLLDVLAEAGVPRVGVGKVDGLFAGRNIESAHTATNAEAFAHIAAALESMGPGLLFANVIEFDQSWGHRNDVAGFYSGLQELDRSLPKLLEPLRGEDLMIFTADHGNDPTTPSTDHSREAVPVLVCGPEVRPTTLGELDTFADIGATVAEYYGVKVGAGKSFLLQVVEWAGH